MNDFARETLPVSLENEMRKSYLDYAMSVIKGRALPDVRDGLKPVHRRVLYGMYETSNFWNRPYVKCARVVGEVMGKFHPHGDQAIYDTLVRMAQSFSLRYPLVDGQGNFGSIDGDNAAAMRYTECRLQRISTEVLADLDKETVNFIPNYDGREKEPEVLPTKLPNLLINGSSGIAVGMATNIPPHHLGEVVDGALYLLENSDASIDDLMQYITAPDFPTGGIIFGLSGVREAYHTGKGRVVVRAKTHFETFNKDRTAIIIDEIPYQVNKKALLEKMAELVRDKKLEGISDARDESDKSGMRVVIELKRGEVPEVVLNNLFKQTQLQDSFGINIVALVDGRPELLNLKQVLRCFLSHRREVVTRRTLYLLRKARDRGHILEGLAVALANIDEFIALIKAAPHPPSAKAALMERPWQSSLVREMLSRVEGHENPFRPESILPEFGLQSDGMYFLSDVQAQEILQMRLQRLTGLEQEKIIQEYREIVDEIVDLIDILDKPERVTTIIANELKEVKEAYSKTGRASQIELNSAELVTEDLITPENRIVTISHEGYIKTQALSEYRAQNRGGRGRSATKLKSEDWIEKMFVGHTHDYILFFTNLGRVYWLKVWELPSGSRSGRGRPLVNTFPLGEGESVVVSLPLANGMSDFPETHFIVLATANGVIKKMSLPSFSKPRKSGIIAIDLDDGDMLIGAALSDGNNDVMLFSESGKAVRFDENDVRMLGRTARGVRGMRLEESERLITLLVVAAGSGDAEEEEFSLVAEEDVEDTSEHAQEEQSDEPSILIVTENGYGKRTLVSRYTRHRRGGKGMITIRASERNGKVIGAAVVSKNDDIMMITSEGVLIRTPVEQISLMGRVTQGVRLIALDDESKLAQLTCLNEEVIASLQESGSSEES